MSRRARITDSPAWSPTVAASISRSSTGTTVTRFRSSTSTTSTRCSPATAACSSTTPRSRQCRSSPSTSSLEGAYRFERLLGNCAVYRKVRDRQFGWKTQAIGRPAADVAAARLELTRLRMEVTPELRASLSGANPLPGWADASKTPAATPMRRGEQCTPRDRRLSLPEGGARGGRLGATSASSRAGTRRRPVSSPEPRSVLLAVGVAAPGLWRLIAVAGVALLAVFLPYRFLREQRRVDRQITGLRDELSGHHRRITSDRASDRIARKEVGGDRRASRRHREAAQAIAPLCGSQARRSRDGWSSRSRDATAALRLSSRANEDG